jgi:branched-chain amino acid transport system substrate-binding protein
MRAPALVRTPALVLGASLAAIALAACSTSTTTAVSVSGTKLTIYASEPPGATGGQAVTDVFDAEKLAFQQSSQKAGKYTLHFVPLHGAELTDNPRIAVQNSNAIAYLGEIQPGTSGDTVPITNELGLLEISPTDTAVYLTQATPAVSGSPGTFYPSSSQFHRTFARVVPTTAQEAKALVGEMHGLGLTKLFVKRDGSHYGVSFADEISGDAASAGLTVVSSPTDADAIFYGGAVSAAATTTLDALASQAPSAKLFGGSGLYDDTFVSGLSAAAQQNLYVSSPGFTSGSLSASGKQFGSAFAAAYGHQPVPEAIFGYEAMSALIAVLDREDALAGDRADVVSAFRTLNDRSSVLGTYSISGGDTSIAPFVIARVKSGALVPQALG